MYEEFRKMVEDRLTKLHDDNSKIEFLTERFEWLGRYQDTLEIILATEYLRPENIWSRVIEPDLSLYGEDENAHRDDELYASAYDEVVNKLVSVHNKDGQLDFLKKLKDRVIEPVYLHQTTEWTNIEKGVQNRLNEVQALQKTTDYLKHTIEKQVELKKNKVPKVVGMKPGKGGESGQDEEPDRSDNKKKQAMTIKESKKPEPEENESIINGLEEEYIKECSQILPKDKKFTQSIFGKLMEISSKGKYKSLPQDTVKKYTFGNSNFTNPSQNMKRYLSKKGITDVLDFKKKHSQFSIYRGGSK